MLASHFAVEIVLLAGVLEGVVVPSVGALDGVAGRNKSVVVQKQGALGIVAVLASGGSGCLVWPGLRILVVLVCFVFSSFYRSLHG